MTIDEAMDVLRTLYPDPSSELDYTSVFELLIAVILSAQTTDIAVNQVTPVLFGTYPDAFALSQADPSDVESILKPLGMQRNKAKFIIDAATLIVSQYHGEVPNTLKALMTLPGVGRKTANVVLVEGFGIPAMPVDTHIERVAKRLGIVDNNATVLEVEKALMARFPKETWHQVHHQLLLFGRYHSTARDTVDIFKRIQEIKEQQHG